MTNESKTPKLEITSFNKATVCTKEEVEQVLAANNLKRNLNLDKKLSELRDDIFAHNKQALNELVSSIDVLPSTRNLINNFEKDCILNRGKFAIINTKMQNDIEKILSEIKEDKLWKIELKKNIETNYAKKHEVADLKKDVTKAEVDIEKLKKFMWQLTAVVGALVWVWNTFGKQLLENL